MATDFNKPATTDAYASVLSYIRDYMASQAKLFDGETPTNLPTGLVRLNKTLGRFERWNGAAYVEQELLKLGGGAAPLEIGAASGSPLVRIPAASATPWALDLYRSDLAQSSRVYNDNGSRWRFEHRPSFAGNTPWDSGNLNIALYAPLASPTFTGTVTLPAVNVTGAFAAVAGVTIGDNAGDSFTINSSSAAIPNSLTFTGGQLTAQAGLVGGGGFSFTGVGVPDVSAARVFDNAGILYLQMGSGERTHLRSKTGGILASLHHDGRWAVGTGGTFTTYRAQYAFDGSVLNGLWLDDGSAAGTPTLFHITKNGVSRFYVTPAAARFENVLGTIQNAAGGFVWNVTNGVDADCITSLSAVGAGTKFARIGPSINVPLLLSVGGTTMYSISPTTGVMTDKDGIEMGWKSIPISSQNSGVLTEECRGKLILATGSVTINNANFTAPCTFLINNRTGASITITQGAGAFFELVGTGSGGSRTLASKGQAMVHKIDSATYLISGTGVT